MNKPAWARALELLQDRVDRPTKVARVDYGLQQGAHNAAVQESHITFAFQFNGMLVAESGLYLDLREHLKHDLVEQRIAEFDLKKGKDFFLALMGLTDMSHAEPKLCLERTMEDNGTPGWFAVMHLVCDKCKDMIQTFGGFVPEDAHEALREAGFGDFVRAIPEGAIIGAFLL